MLISTFQVDCAAWHIPGIKEALAMILERWGEHLKCQGNMWQVCHGWEAAVTMLEWYLSLSDEVVT